MLNQDGARMSACIHHWLVASPSGVGVAMPGVCKHCGAERDFEPVMSMTASEVYRNYPALGQAVESIPVEYGLQR